MSIIYCIGFDIPLSVQASFQGAGVVESTVMSQHHTEELGKYNRERYEKN
jgi:hypothetical protein